MLQCSCSHWIYDIDDDHKVTIIKTIDAMVTVMQLWLTLVSMKFGCFHPVLSTCTALFNQNGPSNQLFNHGSNSKTHSIKTQLEYKARWAVT